MKIGILSNHHFSFTAVNYLLNNGLIACFAVPEFQNQNFQNIKQISGMFQLPLSIIKKKSLVNDLEKWISSVKPDVVFVFSFPYKIPERLLNLPHYGFINFHPSILPSYRGPDPIFWQIKNGVKQTGITAHKMDADFDTGPLIYIEKENISLNDNYGFLESKLSITLLRCVSGVLNLVTNNAGNLPAFEQDEPGSSYYPRVQEKDLSIDWENQDAESIFNLVKAANPKFQGAVTFYKNVPVRIIQSSIENTNTQNEEPGTILEIKNGIKIAAHDKKIISFDIIYVMEGCYTGNLFCNLFNLKAGEKFRIVKK